MTDKLRKDLYDDICDYSNLIGNLIKKQMVRIADESHSIALKMALNKYRNTDSENFEKWLMQQIENDAGIKGE